MVKTALHRASKEGDITTVNSCLSNGFNVNEKDEMEMTPLHYACDIGNTAITDLLLNTKGIDVRSRNNKGQTPLHYTCLSGNVENVSKLLQTDAINDINNANNDDGVTPLHVAAATGHSKIVDELLKCLTINVLIDDVNGDTADKVTDDPEISQNIFISFY
eukprot:gb/GECH01014366.1/.p1 GENE.gb/GECH01014366.1/~~gb/GECH01014366.1/.p1  ORF type:complete len:161 (+),score=41.82 gb/GECH01014366.1/:1-483(+)